ncbi:MAG: FMN-binding negative transcriptional regulator [Rhodospirillales bacterium]|nr:FMN-binding negative transcriptional regulator [Rhodospirillales bacterium]
MFIPRHFANDDRAALQGVMQDYAFALMITSDAGRPFVTHVPLIFDAAAGELGTLLGHVSRANPHWRGFDGVREALAVFQGPHAYVSPSWYETERAVPTWNYIAVHAYGRPSAIEDKEKTVAILKRLVARHETPATGPWSMDRLPADYLDMMVKGIVAFAMPIDRLEGKFKLNQNKSEADRRGVIRGLKSVPDDPLAREVARLMEGAR